MGTFMVVCTFQDGTAMDEVFAVVAEEKAQVDALTKEGRLGSIHLSLAPFSSLRQLGLLSQAVFTA